MYVCMYVCMYVLYIYIEAEAMERSMSGRKQATRYDARREETREISIYGGAFNLFQCRRYEM